MTFATPFVLEKLFDHSCSVELEGSYLGHVPCRFWKVCLGLNIFHRSIMEEIDLLGCSPRIKYSMTNEMVDISKSSYNLTALLAPL